MIMVDTDRTLIVVLFYFLITMIVGLLPFGKKRVDSLEHFHSVTRNISDWSLVFCVLSSIYTSSTWTGWVPLTTQIGIFGLYTTVYIAMAAFLYRLLSPRIYETGRANTIFSLGEYLEYKLNCHGINILVSVVSVFVGAIWVIMELTSLGIIICAAFDYNIDFTGAIVMGLLVIIVYIVWGGMESAVWSSCLHGIIMIVGGAVISVMLVVYKYGSIEDFLWILKNDGELAELSYLNFGRISDFPQWISNAIVSALGMICLPQIFSRMVMGKDANSQKKISRGIGLSALWCLSFVLIGYVAMIENIQVTNSANLIFEIMALSEHEWILYLTYIVMMAAAMGTLDITLFSLATIIITTFVPKEKRIRSEKKENLSRRYTYVTFSRLVIIVLAVLCMSIAVILDKDLTDLAINSYQYICQIFPVLVYAVFVSNPQKKTAFFALMTGVLLTAFLETSDSCMFMTSGFWGLVINSFILITAAVIMKRKKSQV